MKRYSTILFVASAALAFHTSCSVREEQPSNINAVTLFYGRAYMAETKISLSNPYTESGVTYYAGLWESGDKVKVYRESDGLLLGEASLEDGAGTQNGTFSLSGTTGGADVRILYGDNFLPQIQRQEDAGSSTFKNYCFAYSGITNPANGNSFTLSHVPAYIKLSVKAASPSDTYYGYELKSVTFRVPGAVVSGAYTVNYETGEVIPGEIVSDEVTVELDTPFTIGTTGQEVWMAALPSDLTGSLVTVSLELSKGNSSTRTVVKFVGKPLSPGSVNSLSITNMQSIISPGNPEAVEYSTVNVAAKARSSESFGNYPSRHLAGMNRMDKLLVDTRDTWGGYLGVQPDHITSTNCEGFWRTGTYHGRPMFVAPSGNISFLYGVNGVTPDPLSDAADARTTLYYNTKFGSVEAWAEWNANAVASTGFNFLNTNPRRIRNYREDAATGLGISTDAQERLHAGNNKSFLSQTETLYFLRTFLWDYNSITKRSIATSLDTPFLLMFDPEWQDYINRMAFYAAQFFKDAPNFIGYFTDNELPFCDVNGTYGKAISLSNFLEQETEDTESDYYYRCGPPAKAWALQWMQENYGTTNYSASMEPAFVQAVAEYYFRTTAQAIRAADPQHLVMGCRLHESAKTNRSIVEACARYHDVVTFNFYGYWDLSSFTEIASIGNWAGGKPVVITEFYVKNASQKAPDATAYSNNEGAGWMVNSQMARGQFYQNNVIRFIEEGTLAGWMWFKWTDDYRSTIPGWVNKGLVVPDYSGLYDDCTNLMKAMHWNLYQCLDYYWGAPAVSGFATGDIPGGVWE